MAIYSFGSGALLKGLRLRGRRAQAEDVANEIIALPDEPIHAAACQPVGGCRQHDRFHKAATDTAGSTLRDVADGARRRSRGFACGCRRGLRRRRNEIVESSGIARDQIVERARLGCRLRCRLLRDEIVKSAHQSPIGTTPIFFSRSMT